MFSTKKYVSVVLIELPSDTYFLVENNLILHVLINDLRVDHFKRFHSISWSGAIFLLGMLISI